jgi:hypothetical protein
MPLAIVSHVVFGADAANSRGAFRRRSAVPPLRKATISRPAGDPIEERPSGEADDSDEFPSSSAGLSILAQALAAYSQN